MVIHEPLSFGQFNFTLNSLSLLVNKIVVHHFNDFAVDVVEFFGFLFFGLRFFLQFLQGFLLGKRSLFDELLTLLFSFILRRNSECLYRGCSELFSDLSLLVNKSLS